MSILVRFLGLTLLMGALFSCSSGSDSDSTQRVLAVTGNLQINLANKANFTLEGTCTIEGAEITITLGSFSAWTRNCASFTWEVSIPTNIVDQISENTALSLSVEEAGNSTTISGEVLKDVTVPTVGQNGSPAVISTVNQGNYPLAGSCSEKGTITVAIGTLEEKTKECSNGQAWSFRFDVSALTTGSVDIVLSMVDEVGNPSVKQTISVVRDVVGPQVGITTTAVNAAITGTNVEGYDLRGTCQGATSVAVTIGSLAKDDVNCASDSWRLSGKDVRDIPEGNVSIVVRQEDEHGNPGEATLSVIKDVTPPVLGVTSSSLTINMANQNGHQGIQGTCEGAQQVMVTVGSAQAQGVPCASSAWVFSAISSVGEGSHAVTLTQADELGNTATLNPTLVKDVTAPTFAFGSNLGINSANQRQYSLSGTCGETGTITVTVAGLNPVTATCDGANWSSTGVDASSLVDGQVSISASMVDAVGNPAASALTTRVTKDVTTQAVAIGSLDVINSANKGAYEVSGTCSSHAGNVTVTLVSTQTVSQTAACQNSRWATGAFNVSTLADGTVSVTAVFGAVQGSGRSVIKDTAAPTITLATDLSAINKANQGAYTISGTCNEASAVVTVTVGALPARTTTCVGTTWSLGDYNASTTTGNSVAITASIKDQYENTQAANNVTVPRDIVAPIVSISSTSLHINKLNKSNYTLEGSCEAGVSVSGYINKLNKSNYTLEGSCEAGVSVSVTVATLGPESLSCGGDSTWSLSSLNTSALSEGAGLSLVVSQTDSAGNVGSVTATFDKDTTAPTVAITSERKVNLANKGNFTIVGSCSENTQKVGVTIAVGVKVEVDCASHIWTYSGIDLSNAVTFPEGTIAVSITHRDKVGNRVTVSASSTQLDKDITPPTLSFVSTPLPGINIVNQGAYTVTGACSGSDGNKVTIIVTGLGGNYEANCETSWTSTPMNLSTLVENTPINVTVKVEDGHGNPIQVTTNFTKDVTAPTVTMDTLTVITDATVLARYPVSGNCSEPGVAVVVSASSVNPATPPTCGTPSAGRWSTTVDLSALTGTISFGAQQTDAAGNPGSATGQTLEIEELRRYFERQTVALGDVHSCAVTKGKKVLCWGRGASGRLGDDTEVSKDDPVYVVDGDGSVGHLTDIVEVALGSSHSCALKGDGKVLCWGGGTDGQLGNGGTGNKDHPVYVKADSSADLLNIVQITAGGGYTCALNKSGEVLCWGSDGNGKLGNGSTVTANQSYPVFVHKSESSSNHLTDIVQVQAGSNHTCALSSAGKVYCWGSGQYGQLGSSDATTTQGGSTGVDRHAPGAVLTASGGNPLGGIREISLGNPHSCALLGEGGVKCWGSQSFGVLGNGLISQSPQFFPVDVLAKFGSSGHLSGVVQLFTGGLHNCGLLPAGGVQCWGAGGYGSLGNGIRQSKARPVDVILGRGLSTTLSGVISLSGGANGSYSCVQHQQGRLLCWGNSHYGQLGDGHTTHTSYPVTVIDRHGSTDALMKISTFRGTYSCLKGGSRCSADAIGLSIASGSVGTSASVTIAVSGLASAQTLTLYDNSDDCTSSSVGTLLTGSETAQDMVVSALTEGAHKFRFRVSEGGNSVVSCSQNFITYVYDSTSPSDLTLTVPSPSGTETSTTVTVNGIEPSHLVKLYKGSDCSVGYLQATVRSHGNSETITVGDLSTGTHSFRAVATDAAGNSSSCQQTGVDYEVTSL